MRNNIIKSVCNLNFDKFYSYKKMFYSYSIGLYCSFFLTCISFMVFFLNFLSNTYKILLLLLFFLLQLFIQIVFFLHLDMISKVFWYFIFLFFVSLIIIILFIGTFWIMFHMNHNNICNFG